MPWQVQAGFGKWSKTSGGERGGGEGGGSGYNDAEWGEKRYGYGTGWCMKLPNRSMDETRERIRRVRRAVAKASWIHCDELQTTSGIVAK